MKSLTEKLEERVSMPASLPTSSSVRVHKEFPQEETPEAPKSFKLDPRTAWKTKMSSMAMGLKSVGDALKAAASSNNIDSALQQVVNLYETAHHLIYALFGPQAANKVGIMNQKVLDSINQVLKSGLSFEQEEPDEEPVVEPEPEEEPIEQDDDEISPPEDSEEPPLEQDDDEEMPPDEEPPEEQDDDEIPPEEPDDEEMPPEEQEYPDDDEEGDDEEPFDDGEDDEDNDIAPPEEQDEEPPVEPEDDEEEPLEGKKRKSCGEQEGEKVPDGEGLDSEKKDSLPSDDAPTDKPAEQEGDEPEKKDDEENPPKISAESLIRSVLGGRDPKRVVEKVYRRTKKAKTESTKKKPSPYDKHRKMFSETVKKVQKQTTAAKPVAKAASGPILINPNFRG
jgi:hypothetical protein